MIQAKELRIGNVVSIYGKHTVLTLQDIRFIESDNENPKNKGCNSNPIPLTEEWRLNFGFKNNELNFGFFTIEYSEENKVFYLNDIGLKLDYVHQLQNLYFSLTGYELEINL